MIRTAYHYDPELRMWIFLLIAGDDEVLAQGSEIELADAARRAQKARQRPMFSLLCRNDVDE